MTTTITITDTGKRRTSSSSAEETDKANSGNAITLYGVEFSYEDNAVINNQTSIGKLSGGDATAWAAGEVDTLGINKPKIRVRGILRDNNTTDLAYIKMFKDLVRTKGYKTISGTVADWLDGSGNSSTLNVVMASFKLVHVSAHNIINYDLTMYETE